MLKLILWKSISVCYNAGYWSNLESRHHVGGRKEGSRERKKEKKENFGPSSQKSSCVLWHSKKKGWSPPQQKSRNRTDTLTKLLSLQFSVSLPQRREKMPLLRLWTGEKVSIHNRISGGYHRLKCLLGYLSEFNDKLLYLVQSIESSEKP